jgi:leader peptidase (prepilin peptidase) / N-methyltransferase
MDAVAVLRVGVAALLGLCTGSFLNVVIYRLPRRESISRPPSACPGCASPLKRRDLVPVLSWIILRAKCRNCRAPISGRYPFIELLNAVIFGLIALRFSQLLPLAAYLVLGAGCVSLSAIDFDTKTLPTRLVYLTGAVGASLLIVNAFVNGDRDGLVRAAISGAVVATLFFITWFIAPNGIGFGDVRFAGVLAVFTGWLGFGYVFVGLTVAFVGGAVVGIALMAFGGAGRKTAVPFGPFLAIGAMTAILVGQPIIHWWLPAAA